MMETPSGPVQIGERARISGRYFYVPCVYIWRRGYQVLYVGSSLGRPTAADHHVMGVSGVATDDEVECIFYPGIGPDALRDKEDEAIKLLRPTLNSNGPVRGPGRDIVRAIAAERIHELPPQERLAAILEYNKTGELPLASAARRLREQAR